MKLLPAISESYKKPVIDAAWISGALIFATGIMAGYDRGETGIATFFSMAAFWGGVLLIILRRPQSPSKADLQVIRFGSVAIVIVGQILTRGVWYLKGMEF
jgi:hypothetical protein